MGGLQRKNIEKKCVYLLTLGKQSAQSTPPFCELSKDQFICEQNGGTNTIIHINKMSVVLCRCYAPLVRLVFARLLGQGLIWYAKGCPTT
jgi:hypothetical protein